MLFRLLILCMLLPAAGCTTYVVPEAPLRDPVTVYLVDSGRTSSLVIPNASGGVTRYAYGDWDWYALRKTAPWRAIPALLWPTRGALGRMESPAGIDKQQWIDDLSRESQHVYQFNVERDKSRALSQKLDARFQESRHTLVTTPSVGLDFVHYGHSYWAFHNSNHATAGWLHDLGAETRGYPVWSIWKLREPPKDLP